MQPCRADPGPDAALLIIGVVALIDNVVKIVCRFVVPDLLSFEIDKKYYSRKALELPR